MFTHLALFETAYPESRSGGGSYTEWGGVAAESFASGEGTQSSPYVIENAAQLKLFADKIAQNQHRTDFFRLGADIYYNDVSAWETWDESTSPAYPWTPIGDADGPFCGGFDGAGHTIYGLYAVGEKDVAMFGMAKFITLVGLTIDKSYFCGNEFVAAFVGRAKVSSDLYHCVNRAKVICKGKGVAAFIGGGKRKESTPGTREHHAETTGEHFTILNCKNYSDIVGVSYVGGMVGYINSGRCRAQIVGCENFGKIIASEKAAVSVVSACQCLRRASARRLGEARLDRFAERNAAQLDWSQRGCLNAL